MLIGLKVSSLASKCLFYRQEHNTKRGPMKLNFECLEIQKRNITIDTAQK